jgi:hypothetical protein
MDLLVWRSFRRLPEVLDDYFSGGPQFDFLRLYRRH